MLTVGLTGGIGSGKSTVARMLADRGAIVIDADQLAREAVARGTAGFDAVRRRFGDEVVGTDGDLDREALAAIVFADESARRELEAIVHPEVRRRVADTVIAHAETDDIVVLDSPLLIETGAHRDCAVVVVVSADPQTQIDRLVARGMDEADARSRLASQMSTEEKVAFADMVIDNDGSLDELRAEADRVWDRLAIIRG
jgi:dephospho-CoA kinase